MKAQGQKYLAELFGTFVLVFVGSASIIALLKAGFAAGILITVPLAFGFALLAGSVRLRRNLRWALQPGGVARDVPRPQVVRGRSRRVLALPVRRCRARVARCSSSPSTRPQ